MKTAYETDNKKRRTGTAFALAALCVLLLTGCLHRGGQPEQPEQAAVQSLPAVEQAVIAYRDAHGVLPIVDSKPDAPEYEKYRIDFRLLKDGGFLAEIPSSAFERGGHYYYMILDPEDALTVKLLDLRISQPAADLQRLVDSHHARTGEWPAGEPVAPGFAHIDFEALGVPEKQAKSVYSAHYLPYLLHESGRVAIHYALDIMLLLERSGETPEEGSDLARLLVDKTPFVPPACFPYRWSDGEPVPVGR